MRKEYGVATKDGHIEMFTSLREAKAYAKQVGQPFIDVYDNDPESQTYLEILGDIRI